MKHFILTIMVAFCAILSLKAQDTYFQYPQVPDNLVSLQERTTYLVAHFWDRCDMQSAFSSRDRFKKAFTDYVSFMPYADSDTIHSSINSLIETVKKSPENMLILGQIAEETLYGDSAVIWSDELYMPFAQAVVNTKKIPETSKARFRHHAGILSKSQIGMVFPSIKSFDRNGKKTSVTDTISTPMTILMVNDPECEDCLLVKTRLSANIKANQLIEGKQLSIVSIYPDNADNYWKSVAKNYPENWITIAAPEIDSYLDLRMTPSIYILDKDRRIIAKNIGIDSVLTFISNFN